MAIILIGAQTTCATDLNALYASDYDLFWKEWKTTKQKAISCVDHNQTARFLSNAIATLRNAEVTEANAEVIETLAVNNAECFLAAIIKINEETQKEIIENFIARPIFMQATDIRAALQQRWDSEKYRRIKELYERTANESLTGSA